MRRSRFLLPEFAIKASEDTGVPLPSHFTKDDYLMGGMDNSDYTGKEDHHYAAMVVFQDATLSRPQRKPTVSYTCVEMLDS